jgi:23S rRNA (cytosine1962-C5)-methyltransferase
MKRIVLKAGDGKRIKNGHKKLEGLSLENEIYFGDILKDIIISENSIKFYTDILNGQKTGFFFDQRDKRQKFSQIILYWYQCQKLNILTLQ